MKLYVAMLAAGIAGAAAGGEIADVKTVYVLPMSNALDQFLAIRLTTGNVLQVVTDPQKADAILTDHLGAGLDKQLDNLYGAKTPPPRRTNRKTLTPRTTPRDPWSSPCRTPGGPFFSSIAKRATSRGASMTARRTLRLTR